MNVYLYKNKIQEYFLFLIMFILAKKKKKIKINSFEKLIHFCSL